jgi:hypothetical protein
VSTASAGWWIKFLSNQSLCDYKLVASAEHGEASEAGLSFQQRMVMSRRRAVHLVVPLQHAARGE